MTLPGLLAACRDLYLLVDPTENHPDAELSSRLADDTLAPLVRRRFEEWICQGSGRGEDRRAGQLIGVAENKVLR